MSLFSRLLTAAAVLGLIWFFWPFGGGSDEVVKTVDPPGGHQGLFTTPLPPEEDQAAEAAPDQPEPIGTATQTETESAATANSEQIAAIAPGAALSPKTKLKAIRFYRVTVLDGGTLETRGDIVIKLDGIDVKAADETCKDARGRTWACGTRARAALTRLIRGRAVVCRVPENAKSATARCRLGDTDLSTWMVTQGWAKPSNAAEPQLAKAAEAAQKKKIGLWR